MRHENLDPRQTPRIGSARAFGIVFAVVFAIIAVWPVLQGLPYRVWALVMAAIFGATAWLKPEALAPLNRAWFRFGMLLHRVASPLALAVIYFGIITPFAVVMRLFGRDLLLLKRDRPRESFWVPRDPPGPPADSLKNQF